MQELGKLREALERDKNDIASVRADNVKLYEKIKYLESYSDPTRKRVR